MPIVGLIVAIPLIIIISLSVFGGGQVFMPIFSWLWNLFANNFGVSMINEDTINKIFTISNTTPGVVSTKFAFFTGYIVANGAWWGYLAMFLTYLLFCLPAIIVMVIAMKYINKFKHNTYVANMLIIMKPIVAGIMASLALQLLISVLFPEIYFNKSVEQYFGKTVINQHSSATALFFASNTPYSKLCNILLKIYVPLGIIGSYIVAKKGYSLFVIIIINIIISFILFLLIPYLAGYPIPTA
ncbi:chromate transporter [Mycoplasma sp. NEAQ87857]|uniref:chromate transporter n=1 Tax=Mycoplasma sp. NEAQ87857 TaxID=2683967 RepID=UPI0013175F2B|nr:chromate transporter [Mycoplasma sp. NEAQ87857]QGZ97211.1 chromate transporter [Mycoplasma sp. NEAQ87857]